MGCLLQFQEADKIDTTVVSLLQQASDAALGALNDGDTQVRDSALDLLRSLPARTVEEIALVRQIAEGIQDQRAREACAKSLQYARPVDNQAWQELEKGRGSSVTEVREAVTEAMERRKK